MAPKKPDSDPFHKGYGEKDYVHAKQHANRDWTKAEDKELRKQEYEKRLEVFKSKHALQATKDLPQENLDKQYDFKKGDTLYSALRGFYGMNDRTAFFVMSKLLKADINVDLIKPGDVIKLEKDGTFTLFPQNNSGILYVDFKKLLETGAPKEAGKRRTSRPATGGTVRGSVTTAPAAPAAVSPAIPSTALPSAPQAAGLPPRGLPPAPPAHGAPSGPPAAVTAAPAGTPSGAAASPPSGSLAATPATAGVPSGVVNSSPPAGIIGAPSTAPGSAPATASARADALMSPPTGAPSGAPLGGLPAAAPAPSLAPVPAPPSGASSVPPAVPPSAPTDAPAPEAAARLEVIATLTRKIGDKGKEIRFMRVEDLPNSPLKNKNQGSKRLFIISKFEHSNPGSFDVYGTLDIDPKDHTQIKIYTKTDSRELEFYNNFDEAADAIIRLMEPIPVPDLLQLNINNPSTPTGKTLAFLKEQLIYSARIEHDDSQQDVFYKFRDMKLKVEILPDNKAKINVAEPSAAPAFVELDFNNKDDIDPDKVDTKIRRKIISLPSSSPPAAPSGGEGGGDGGDFSRLPFKD